MKKTLCWVGLLLVTSVYGKKRTISGDALKNRFYQKKCVEIRDFLVRKQFKLECHESYHHYGADSAEHFYLKDNKDLRPSIKLASFNLWHPGNLKSSFKDYRLLAEIVNSWDVMAGLELLANIGKDAIHNERLIKVIKEVNRDLKNVSSDAQKLVLEKKREELHRLYKAPGYYKLLMELKKLDPSWALILSPRGEAAKSFHQQELVGLFYRARLVKPVPNEHCRQYINAKEGGEFQACYPNLRRSFMGRDVRSVFSRRPFLASFQAGNWDFSLVVGHVIFNSPEEEAPMKDILQGSFGVDHYSEVGFGVAKNNYARFAEVNVTMELMQKLMAEYKEKDVLYFSDMNLKPTNPFLKKLMNQYTNLDLFMKKPTSLSINRYDKKGRSTQGSANSYDHFVFDKTHTSECVDGDKARSLQRHHFMRGKIRAMVDNKYLVRDNHIKTPSIINKDKIKRHLKKYRNQLKREKTIKRGKIVPAYSNVDIERKVAIFKSRVFTSQIDTRNYYRLYKEILSDHFPISMECSVEHSDDDQ